MRRLTTSGRSRRFAKNGGGSKEMTGGSEGSRSRGRRRRGRRWRDWSRARWGSSFSLYMAPVVVEPFGVLTRPRLFFPLHLFFFHPPSSFIFDFLFLHCSHLALFLFSLLCFLLFSLLLLLLLSLLSLHFRLSVSLFAETSLLLSFFASTLLLLGFTLCLTLLALLLALPPLLLQLLLLLGLGSCFLCGLFGFPSGFFFFLRLPLESLLILLLLRFSGLLGRPLLVPGLFLHEFLDQLLLTPFSDPLTVRRQDTLFKHPSRKDLEHSASLFHALLLRHGILDAVSTYTQSMEKDGQTMSSSS